MLEKIMGFFRRSAGYLAAFLASGIYILTSFIELEAGQKTVTQIIADGVISYLLGYFIARAFDMQGIMSGEREGKVVSAKKEHGDTVYRISPLIDKLDDWCEGENKKNYRIQRAKILARGGLRYDDCFDEDGVAKDWVPNEEHLKSRRLRKKEKRKMRAFRKAVRLKLTSLTAFDLTSDGGRDNDPFYFGRTKMEYERQRSGIDIVSRIGTALIVGYYGVSFIRDLDYGNLIWHAMQVAIFILAGVICMYQSYSFVTDEYCGRVCKKTDCLQKFENFAKTKEEGEKE